MDLVGEKGNETFVCRCGYKEKLAAFNQRKEKNSKAMSKKEVQRFIKKNEQKQEPFNNPFAEILQKKIDKD
jgi:DNA topoisomerase-3